MHAPPCPGRNSAICASAMANLMYCSMAAFSSSVQSIARSRSACLSTNTNRRSVTMPTCHQNSPSDEQEHRTLVGNCTAKCCLRPRTLVEFAVHVSEPTASKTRSSYNKRQQKHAKVYNKQGTSPTRHQKSTEK